MNNRFLYKTVIALLMISTLTCNLVMVTFLHRFFYGDLRVDNPATLHRLASTLGTHGNLGYQDYLQVVKKTEAFDRLSAVMPRRGLPVYIGEHVVWADVAWATGDFYKVIGRNALRGGRFINENDDHPGAAKVAVVNQSAWERFRPGEPFDYGEQIVVKGTSFEIVGVVENAFPYLDSLSDIDIWIPALQNPDQWEYEVDDYQEYQVLARLDPSMREIAEQQLDIALEDIPERLGFEYQANVLSETQFRVNRNPRMHKLFQALLVVTGFLFVLGTVNQLLMLVTRSLAIDADLKIMVSLGARAKHVLGRFIRGLLTVLGSALLGVVVCSMAIIQLYNHLWGAQFGEIASTKLLEPMPMAMLGGLSLLLVALHLGFPFLMYVFRGESLMLRDRAAGSRFSIKRLLPVTGVAIQIGLVTFTILGSSAFLQSLNQEGSTSAGPYEHRTVFMELALASKETESGNAFRSRLDALKSGLMELGGVEMMSTSGALPLHQGGWTRALIEGEALDPNPEWIAFDFVTPGYFETVGLSFLKGEDFRHDDAARWPYGKYIINQAYADRHFSGLQILGRKIVPWDGAEYGPIIGVVENIPMTIGGEIKPCIYIPSYQNRFIFNIRLSDSSLVGTHINAIAEKINEIDPEVIIVSIDTIDTVWKEALAAPKLGFYILIGLSAVGLVLSMSGAFGYQTYMMLLREREFAIRHSLGQNAQAIYWSEVKRGVWIAIAGLGLGIGAYTAAQRMFGAYFFNITLSFQGYALVALFLVVAFFGIVSTASLASMRPRLSILMRD